MKTCTECGAHKPFDAFYKNYTMRDGRLNQCIPCVRAARAAYREANREKVRKQGREFYLRHRDKRIAAVADYQARKPDVSRAAVASYRARYPEHHRVHQRAQKAKQRGNLVATRCQGCGTDKHVHAHHEDYSKPFDVTWLCPPCHGQRHREINDARREVAQPEDIAA